MSLINRKPEPFPPIARGLFTFSLVCLEEERVKTGGKVMMVTLIDVAEAGERLDAGQQAYEYQTEDKNLRILGPACGFGAQYLQRLRGEGLYAETLEEARAHARTRNVALTGVWFVKQSQ